MAYCSLQFARSLNHQATKIHIFALAIWYCTRLVMKNHHYYVLYVDRLKEYLINNYYELVETKTFVLSPSLEVNV